MKADIITRNAKDIRIVTQSIGIWTAVINSAVQVNEETGLKELLPTARNADDLNKATNALEKLIRLREFLLGNVEGRFESVVKVREEALRKLTRDDRAKMREIIKKVNDNGASEGTPIH